MLSIGIQPASCGTEKARYATTDARQYQDFVVTDAPAPAVPRTMREERRSCVKQSTSWGALFWF